MAQVWSTCAIVIDRLVLRPRAKPSRATLPTWQAL